jgi:hypothetical protein
MDIVMPSEVEESRCERDNLAPRRPSTPLRRARDDN